jgi:hypothetical protein
MELSVDKGAMYDFSAPGAEREVDLRKNMKSVSMK